MRRLIAALLLAVFPISAGSAPIALEWGDFRRVADHVRHRERVTVRTGPEGRERIRGKLVEISDSGITVAKRGPSPRQHVWIERERVRSVRLSPKKGNPVKWRALAGVAAFPLWIVGMTFGLSIPGGIPEGRWYNNRHTGQGVIFGFGLPIAVYALAQRADRRKGAIVIELKEGKEN